MKLRAILGALFLLLFLAGVVSKTSAAPDEYNRVWHRGRAWNWRHDHRPTFVDGYYWRYRGNRVGAHAMPGHFYRPWLPKRREFHNADDDFSHRYYR